MPRQYARKPETTFDLYNDRDNLPWFYRAVGLAASWLALTGYALFVLVFTSLETDLRTSQAVLTAVAGVCVAVGYASGLAISLFSESLLFALDGVLMPFLTTSGIGIVITVLNVTLHRDFPDVTQIYIYAPLATSCVATITVGILCMVALRKIERVKEQDKARRQYPQAMESGRLSHLSNYSNYSNYSHYSHHGGGYGDNASTHELIPMSHQVPEDEAQRRQLLRLLLSREAQTSPGLPSSTTSTYHIDLPGQGAPQAPMEVAHTRPRSGSLPSSGSKWNPLSKMGRHRSPTVVGNFKDPRERRREEIERSTVLAASSSDHSLQTKLHTPAASPREF